MDYWFFTALFIICLSYLLELAVSILNIKALAPDIPREFADVLNPKEYLKSQSYTKATTFFSLFESTYSTLLILLFLIFGGFQYLDMFARQFTDNEIFSGLIFTGSLLLLSFLSKLPFSIYSTFVIEERFGFNKTTIKVFIADILKSGFLIILIGCPLFAGILWFFMHAGYYGWLYCWIVLVVFSLILQYLAPVIILPLFNKFTPLPEGSLRSIIFEYAQLANFRIQGIYTMDGSKRSTKLNAFFVGFGRFKKIVFFDTLLEKLNENEIVAVLAHEMGHYKLKHIPKMAFASILQTGIMFYLLSFFLNVQGIAQSFGVQRPSVYVSLVIFGLLYAPISLLVSIGFHAISRKYEFEADSFAAQSIESPELLISSLKKLSHANLSNLTPHPFTVFIHHSHPPLLLRIHRLRTSNF